jgi:quercetin dioxygenase-like cupin family protein
VSRFSGLLAASAAAALAVVASAQTRLTPPEVAALAAPAAVSGTSGAAGIRTAVLAGDPSRPGPYTIALSVPPNTRIAAHRHRDDRTAVVVAGTWYLGYGAPAREGAFKALPPGSFYAEPANAMHFARTGAEPALVYISGLGPSDTVYAEAATDPRGERR